MIIYFNNTPLTNKNNMIIFIESKLKHLLA